MTLTQAHLCSVLCGFSVAQTATFLFVFPNPIAAGIFAAAAWASGVSMFRYHRAAYRASRRR